MDYIIGQNRPTAQQTPVRNAPTNAQIVDVNQQNFMQEVFEASLHQPVIVDFWASWCNPCKNLTPILEKHVKAAGGRVKLAKIDVDANASLVAQLAQTGLPVQSIPLVAVFFKRQILDIMQGDQPESEVRRFIEQTLKATGATLPSADILAAAQTALNEGQVENAAELFSSMLEIEPENPEGWGGLIRSLIALHEIESAEDALNQIPPSIKDHPAISGARAALDLHQEGQAAAAKLEPLRAELATQPDNPDLLFRYAGALNGIGEKAEAAEQLLSIIRKDRNWNDGAARAELLRFFEAWGPTDTITLNTRRKLSALLFS